MGWDFACGKVKEGRYVVFFALLSWRKERAVALKESYPCLFMSFLRVITGIVNIF